MNKRFAKYMRYGKTVKSSWTDNEFKLIEDMNENKTTVKAVSLEKLRRWELLKAWIYNWEHDKDFRERFTMNIEDCRKEKSNYEEELKISDIIPNNKIRFIYPDYTSKFEVDDLSKVLVNGKSVRVAYYDDYHFLFVDTGRIFHICEYAELCEKNRIKVRPVR